MGITYRKTIVKTLPYVLIVTIGAFLLYSTITEGSGINQVLFSTDGVQPVNPFQQHFVILLALLGFFGIQRIYRLDTPLALLRISKKSAFYAYYIRRLTELSVIYIMLNVVAVSVIFLLLQRLPITVQITGVSVDDVKFYPFSACTYIVTMFLNALIINLFYVLTSFKKHGEILRVILLAVVCHGQAIAYYGSPVFAQIFVFCFSGYSAFRPDQFLFVCLAYLFWFVLASIVWFLKDQDYC